LQKDVADNRELIAKNDEMRRVNEWEEEMTIAIMAETKKILARARKLKEIEVSVDVGPRGRLIDRIKTPPTVSKLYASRFLFIKHAAVLYEFDLYKGVKQIIRFQFIPATIRNEAEERVTNVVSSKLNFMDMVKSSY